MMFKRWGPTTFSHLKSGGVVGAWRSAPAPFLPNSFSTRDQCSIISGTEKLSDEECLLRVQRWIGGAYAVLHGDGELALQDYFSRTARRCTLPLSADVIGVMESSGLWSSGELDELR